jgi:phage shock protein C
VPDEAAYCPACGTAQHTSTTDWRGRQLRRIPNEGKIAGVCAGIANYLEIDVTFVRAAWLILSIVPGAVVGGVVAYLLAWMIMPAQAPGSAVASGPTRRLWRSDTDRKIAGVCGGLAEYFEVDATPIRLLWLVLTIMPGAIVGGVVVYIAAWLIMPRKPVAMPTTSSAAAGSAA